MDYFAIYENYKKMCTNYISMMSQYNWSGDFVKSEAQSVYDKLIKQFDNTDFTQFTVDELKRLDFKMWDDNLILMPIWAIDCLPDGAEVYSIDESKVTFNKSIGLDKDVRFGVTAFGFTLPQLRDARISNILEK